MSRRSLTLFEDPVPKPRPRVTRTGHAYTPTHAMEAERRLRQAWLDQHGPEPSMEPIRLTVEVYLRMPAGIPKKRREAALPAKRPDLDNYLKTCLDGLNGVAWLDDAQVVVIGASKTYARDPAVPAWRITVEDFQP